MKSVFQGHEPVKPYVYVVIPVFNRLSFTRRCLDCLRQQGYPVLKVVVVDDRSTDGTAEVVRREYPEVVLLEGTGDLWWTGGTNLGMQWVLERARDDEFILLMNNDLTFDPSLVETLVGVARVYPKSVVASVESTTAEPDRLLAGARRVNWWTGRQTWLDVGRLRKEFPPGTVKLADYVTGRGVLYPVSCIREIGLVYPGYLHIGDFELGVRAKKHGWTLLTAYDAVVYHQSGLDDRGINTGPYRLRDIVRYYADRRSYASLRNIGLNAIRCTRNPLQAISYFVLSVGSTLLHFLKHLQIRGRVPRPSRG